MVSKGGTLREERGGCFAHVARVVDEPRQISRLPRTVSHGCPLLMVARYRLYTLSPATDIVPLHRVFVAQVVPQLAPCRHEQSPPA
jgi:hypothetical protein